MVCPKCGKPVSDSAKFCGFCGTKLDQAGGEPAPGPAQHPREPAGQPPTPVRPAGHLERSAGADVWSSGMVSAALAVCIAVMAFTKWFRLDLYGLAYMFGADTSFSIFQVNKLLKAFFYGDAYSTAYMIYIGAAALFVVMALWQAYAAYRLFTKQPAAVCTSVHASIYSGLLSGAAIALSVYLSSQTQELEIGVTVFPVMVLILSVAEIFCTDQVSKGTGYRQILTKKRIISLLMLVAGSAVWWLIVKSMHVEGIGGVILFFSVFLYWGIGLLFISASD